MEPLEIIGSVSAVAQGLRSPDGIARDAESGDIYVSEEDQATIVRIKPDGSRHILFTQSTPVYEEIGSIRKKVTGLRSPEGLALDKEGRLYVVEDIPGGRLISFNIREPALKSYPCGKVVPIPMEDSRFAWESVDVGPQGELLVAGSTMESFLSEPENGGLLGLFRGAILYRDAHGKWWMPLNASMISYSAVCFSKDGHIAFFAGEIPGVVGCLDLRTHNLRTYYSDIPLHSPEGLCALPDGSVLVAEEGGKIFRWDPMIDTIQQTFENVGRLESIYWDGAHRRLLATDDHLGDLLSLELKADMDFVPPQVSSEILFESQYVTAEMIPEECPSFLKGVLKIGGYDPSQAGSNLAFQAFARQYSLVAVDAEAMLISSANPGVDPIKRVQFVIVAPYLIGSQGGKFIWSSSGFVAVMKSGRVVKTQLVQREVIRGDIMECLFTPMGGQQLALPIPISSRIDTDGVVSIHFMGMGVTPDYLVLLNTATPETSFLLVMQPEEKPQLYAINLPPKHDRRHWVIALQHKVPAVWRDLSAEK
jgi:sugar lactone lactonase YvrE